MVTPIFVDFYEAHRPWIRDALGEIDEWPELFRFAWAVRNAISHNGGRINIADPKRRAVRWHKLSYDHRHAGTAIIGPVLFTADIIILLCEMSELLDALGCPVSA